MRAKIQIWNKEYFLTGIDWYSEGGDLGGKLCHVVFSDELGSFHTVFNTKEHTLYEENEDVNKGSLRLDLSKKIIWIKE
ncbi:hypothetical protein [Lentibacillus amyloliquefaciens]|uniref:Uncharacterized protein n=1 Tax=Lentibacillus amyloliquefaciens TaxID=1472767 RepID=A0A0U4FRU4_9BACI|nr:hypothetical protein [Lentibacillus amyloliquefaciens]ALX50436.1 hypothetical protein AOX59_18735 [Lentibacillus amyloliquefaciens]